MTGAHVGETQVALRVLVVDDEAPAREDLAFLLDRDERICDVQTAANAGHALKLLNDNTFDAVFCDIKMPGLDGVELARVVSRFAERPQIVFVTAYDDHAVDAFELRAVDYVMKPVREDRLAEAVRRVASTFGSAGREPDDETIAVELAGVTRFVRRSQIRYVEAQGDYARLHTLGESHLLRTPLSTLAHRWSEAGFIRIHRSTLVAQSYIEQVRVLDGHCTVIVAGVELPVSRRHSRDLRERVASR